MLATQKLKANQEWVITQQRRLKLKQQNDERYCKWLNWLVGVIGRSANAWMFFISWVVVAGAWGWVGGINTPVSIICSTHSSLCYQARIWGMKAARSNMPKPECTKTSKGLMCVVVPNQIHKKPHTHNLKRR